MKNIKIELVLSFLLKDEAEVLNILQTENFNFIRVSDYFCVTTDTSLTDNIDKWLTSTLNIINFTENKKILSLLDSSILHIYLPAESRNDEFLLKFSAKNLEKLWRLATIIDLDYGLIYPNAC